MSDAVMVNKQKLVDMLLRLTLMENGMISMDAVIANILHFPADVPDTNVGEMIYKQSAISRMSELCESCRENPNGYCGSCRYDDFVAAVKHLPAARPDLIECDPVLACMEATMDKTISACQYLSVVRELEERGYVLAMRRREG